MKIIFRPSVRRGTGLPDNVLLPDDFMRRALTLSRSGLGRCAPNPCVGCVIVKDGIVVGEARSADGGRPHAETQALSLAGEKARGADVYVTLEPCAHVGKTPPCAHALIEAGVARVYVSCIDPDPRVAGKGIAMLRAAGIDVFEGMAAEEAARIHEGFFLTQTQGRPLISLKVATSLDGRIAAADGSSQWITGEEARLRGHELRAQYDAILTGSGTVLADNPRLTARFAGHDGHQPRRIILDRRGRISDPSLHILADGGTTDILKDYKTIDDLFPVFMEMGLTRVLVEAGRELGSAFLKSGAVDRIYWFRAPALLGQNGLPVFDDLDVGRIGDRRRFVREAIEPAGEDVLEIYRRAL